MQTIKACNNRLFTILVSETLQIWWTDIGYLRYFVKGSDFTDHNRINGLVFCHSLLHAYD
jgi:phosphoketolase